MTEERENIEKNYERRVINFQVKKGTVFIAVPLSYICRTK